MSVRVYLCTRTQTRHLFAKSSTLPVGGLGGNEAGDIMGSRIPREQSSQGSIDRRSLLKSGALAAGALWVAPTVMTFMATPASASGSYNTAKFGSSSTSTFAIGSITSPTAGGLLIVGLAGVDDNSGSTVSFSTPSSSNTSGWATVVASDHSSARVGRRRYGVTSQVWSANYTASAAIAPTITISGSTGNSVGFVAFFPDATTASQGNANNKTTASGLAVTAPGGTLPGGSWGTALWTGWMRAADATTYSTPGGFTNSMATPYLVNSTVGIGLFYESLGLGGSAGSVSSTLNGSTGAYATIGTTVLVY
jgi:hypothetical protein